MLKVKDGRYDDLLREGSDVLRKVCILFQNDIVIWGGLINYYDGMLHILLSIDPMKDE